MKKRNIVIPIAMLAVLVACSVPVSAWWYNSGLPLSDSSYCNADPECRCTVWENIVISNGTYNIELISTLGFLPDDYNYTFTVPWYDNLMYAGLYEDVWSANSCGPMEFTYNGNFLGRLHFGTSGDGCERSPCDSNDNVAGNGYGGNGVWRDVTALTNPGQINWLFKDDVSYAGCSFDGRDRGCSLITWGQNYNSTDDTLYLWFNQGMEDEPVPDTHIYNVSASVATEWTLYVCIGTGDTGDEVIFNGHHFAWSAPNHWLDVNSYNVTAYVNSPETTNTIGWYSSDDYFHPYWTLLIGRMPGAVQEPDLVVTDIEFLEMMRPNINQQVNATILNQGDAGTGVKFNVSLEVDGSPYDKVGGVGPLAVDESTTVGFTVNLAANCHEFKVVTECDNDISESNENNNERTGNYQVGYVIVVRSNSNFEKLNESGDSALPAGCFKNESGTYYIQDLTITNCAGVGITIENTTVPFVIKNCTVYGCQNDGVYFHDLTKGRVEDSRVRDNPGKGIRVKNSTYVDIKDNNVFNNGGYGIEVYPKNLGVWEYVSDCQFVNITNNMAKENFYGIEVIGYNCTVKHNTARNNSQYGIYVYGKYNEIEYNDIKYNDDYGVKMFNSTDCNICWNNFIDNNRDFPARTSQGYDDRNNRWNTTVPTTNYTGNYWGDYNGSDNNNDEIGDTPYPIADGTVNDYYPLMNLVMCGDVNCDGSVNFEDMGKVRRHRVFGEPICNPWAGDVNCDGCINFGDMGKVRRHSLFGEPLNCCKDC
jgi:parallel beta-helix repeat protein